MAMSKLLSIILFAATIIAQCPTICGDDSDYINIAVRRHNYYRNMHGVPNVSINSNMNQLAQRWANYLAETDQFKHSNVTFFGQNFYNHLGSSQNRHAIMTEAIQSFYDQIKLYDWRKPGFSADTAQFTQLIWKSSIKIGVGIAVYRHITYGHKAVVCIYYDPPGNAVGEFAQNVLPPIKSL